ncbi:hypothetical protein BC567DRAFT_214175 [Phyllosticta citribraziliensis]
MIGHGEGLARKRRRTVREVTAVERIGVEGGRQGWLLMLLLLLPGGSGAGHVLVGSVVLIVALVMVLVLALVLALVLVPLAIMGSGLEQVIMVASKLLAGLVFIEVHVIGSHVERG